LVGLGQRGKWNAGRPETKLWSMHGMPPELMRNMPRNHLFEANASSVFSKKTSSSPHRYRRRTPNENRYEE
jgi:hypothetical protein